MNKTNPFSLLFDGSNDTGLEKLNPLTVKVYDHSRRQDVTHLLDMRTTSGRDCGTSLAIFTKISFVLQDNSIPWGNCVGFGVGNTSVNNSIMRNVLQEYREYYGLALPPGTKYCLSYIQLPSETNSI